MLQIESIEHVCFCEIKTWRYVLVLIACLFPNCWVRTSQPKFHEISIHLFIYNSIRYMFSATILWIKSVRSVSLLLPSKERNIENALGLKTAKQVSSQEYLQVVCAFCSYSLLHLAISWAIRAWCYQHRSSKAPHLELAFAEIPHSHTHTHTHTHTHARTPNMFVNELMTKQLSTMCWQSKTSKKTHLKVHRDIWMSPHKLPLHT